PSGIAIWSGSSESATRPTEAEMASRRCMRRLCPYAAAFIYGVEDSRAHAINLFSGQIGINRKRNAAVVLVLGVRKISRTIAELALIVRMKMQRLEMHAAANSLRAQTFHEIIPVDREMI